MCYTFCFKRGGARLGFPLGTKNCLGMFLLWGDASIQEQFYFLPSLPCLSPLHFLRDHSEHLKAIMSKLVCKQHSLDHRCLLHHHQRMILRDSLDEKHLMVSAPICRPCLPRQTQTAVYQAHTFSVLCCRGLTDTGKVSRYCPPNPCK